MAEIVVLALTRGLFQAVARNLRSSEKEPSRRPEVVKVLSEKELAQRPEVQSINRYIIFRTCILIVVKRVGALALLWATVVLLGGFVSSLSQTHFWFVTGIAFLQATGMFDVFGDAMFLFIRRWVFSTESFSATELRPIDVFTLVLNVLLYGPTICVVLSVLGLINQHQVYADGVTSVPNLKPALKLYYYVSLVHGAICLLMSQDQLFVDALLVKYVCRQLCISMQVVYGYLDQTKMLCLSNMVSLESWNLLTYATGLLDSQLPQDYACGLRVVTILIDHGVPMRQVLTRSPGSRVHKLIGALVLTSPVDGETRWLAARIVEHIACDLRLAQFPAALECVISLLFDTSSRSDAADHEALKLLTGHAKGKTTTEMVVDRYFKQLKSRASRIARTTPYPLKWLFKTLRSLHSRNAGMEDDEEQKKEADSYEGEERVITNGDLILQGLRILENLTHDQHNCTVIYNAKDLISRVVAPASSRNFTQEIDNNAAWIQVVDASLRVVIRLMRQPGETGKKMRSQIADSSNTVENLETILRANANSSSILELQMRATEIFAELFSHNTTTNRSFIEKTLHIFCTAEWMENYLTETIKIDENQMEEAMETASRVKEKAGEALARLSMGNSEAILHTNRSFTQVVNRLTQMLDSKTIQCTIAKISGTETVDVETKIGCRISAAIILKHMCPLLSKDEGEYVQDTTLKKVLVELLLITIDPQSPQSRGSTRRARQILEHLINICSDRSTEMSHDLQDVRPAEERMLQASLLSLCAAICARYSIKASHLATKVAQHFSQEDLVEKLEKMVDENIRATPACLAILKLTCKMVEELIRDDQTIQDIDMKKKIISTLSQVVDKISQASEKMVGLENAMLFAGTYADLYGIPVKPPLSVLVKQVEVLVEQRKLDLGMSASAGGP